jgi:hypothetical protein
MKGTMKNKHTSPWAWIPTLYFAQGLPYVAVMTISVIMYKRLGISNTELAFYTGWLNLPWVIKPLWSPFIDLIKTKRWWIITMQLLIGAGLAGIAFTIPTEHFFQLTLAVLKKGQHVSAYMPIMFSVHYSITKPIFFLLHLSFHLIKNTQSIKRLKLEPLPLTPVSTVSVSAILSCRPFFILIFLPCIKMKHYGFSRKGG